jgi:hypothetical protein
LAFSNSAISFVSLRAHRLEIGDRDAHLIEHSFDPAADLVQFRRLALRVDLDVHVGLGDRFRRGGASRRELDGLAGGVAPHAENGGGSRKWMWRSRRLSSALLESTRNGMSSFTISITVCSRAHPFDSAVGLKRRIFAFPRPRISPNSQSDSAPPRRMSKEL